MSLDDELRARGFGGRVGGGTRPALVVVDATRGFTDPDSPLFCAADDALRAIGELQQAMRAANLPVIFSSVVVDQAQRDAAAHFLRKMPGLLAIAENPAYSEIDPRVAPRGDEPVLEKIFPSVFFGTPLASMLAAREIDTVIVTGMSTSGCVRATAVDALQYGYRVVVVPEAVADRDQDAGSANLRDLSLKYADLVGLTDVITYIEELQDAD